MKPFSLVRKYAAWCDEVNKGDTDYFWDAFVMLGWPSIFSIICTMAYGFFAGLHIASICGWSITFALIMFFTPVITIWGFKIEDMKWQPHCFLSNWLPIILADIALLPLVGMVGVLKKSRARVNLVPL